MYMKQCTIILKFAIIQLLVLREYEYLQHYYYNFEFNNNNGLVFCLVGGECKISKAWIGNKNYTWLRWAQKFGAATFELNIDFMETASHYRKFDMSTASYQYFTIEQVLADLQTFIEEMNKKFFKNVKHVGIYVVFVGALSACFRSKYPNMTLGAISS
ncbi:unnamed protein product [Thelazia callipaeda]|uniref:Lysosomal Pro-X carboxypeptidase n=1 Tax=Thelazia callipaeda TaxID=103827 RepID=A0A0N5CN90_THECL|nr:unnamed protein product [Thelazia callipaeda]